MADELNGAAPAAAESTPAPTPAPEAAPAPAVDAPPPAVPLSFDEDLKANAFKIYAKNNPPRDRGRFAPHIPTATPIPDSGQDGASEAPATDQAPNEAPAPAQPASEAPTSWSAEMKAEFASLPPKVQDYIRTRDKETSQQFTRMGQENKAHQALRAVADQHAPFLQQIGRSPEATFQEAIEWAQALRRNPGETIRQLAAVTGTDLARLAAGQSQQQQSNPNAQLYAYVQQLEARLNAREQTEYRTLEQAAVTAIDKFARDSPHFETLQEDMQDMLPRLRAANPDWSHEQLLKKAYDKALRQNDALWEQMQAEKAKANEAKVKAEQDKRLKEAKLHQTINQRSDVSATLLKGNWEDTLRHEVEKRVQRR